MQIGTQFYPECEKESVPALNSFWWYVFDVVGGEDHIHSCRWQWASDWGGGRTGSAAWGKKSQYTAINNRTKQ